MMEIIDNFLNRITMYRLVLYYLIFLLAVAAILGQFGVLPYPPLAIFSSVLILLAVSWVTNKIFARLLKVQTNVESVYITALILALIITPPQHGAFLARLPFLFWAAVWAQACKYILNIGRKHIFNPAAFAVALTALTINQSASWWVGTSSLFVFSLLGGFLIIRKVRRFDAVVGFLAAAVLAMFVLSLGHGNPFFTVYKSIIYSPLLFFGAIMLTEPLTMPPTRDGRIAYGILVGWLFAPQTHLGSFYFTPELALLVGNLFSYLISPKGRYVLELIEKKAVGLEIYDFIFRVKRNLKFKPGQYMEWTLGHKHTDNRGNRRYFTLASSPTEHQIILGVKFYPQPSSFKRQLLALRPGDQIVAGQLAGDFVLPKNSKEKLVFLAGGIGITPFRSMLKYLVDHNEKREVVLIYSNRKVEEIVYHDVLYDAWKKLGVKIVCTLTAEAPADWDGYEGYVTPRMIAHEVPDFMERTFYLSGSHNMVTAFEENLLKMGVHRAKIKTDFFPGLV